MSPESHTKTVVPGTTAPTGPVHTPPALPFGHPGAFRHFAPGQPFGERYTIVEEVGVGGMGQVYKVLDRTLGRPVALKLIRPDAAAHTAYIERFRRELALAREVTHSNVCRVHDLDEQDGLNYLTMEYIEGQTLEDLIQSVGHLSPRQTVVLGRQICAGLAAIHEKAIIHRDLKPGNIMVDRAGVARVMDFGTAYHEGQDRLTDAGGVMGTLAYLSPEQARGQAIDARSDIYAAGLILYEMLTGKRPPADSGHLPLALRDSGERCPPPSQLSLDVPPALDTIVMRCLERDPKRRFGSALELEQALAATLTSPTGLSGRAWPVASPATRRNRLLGWAAAAGLAVAALALIPLLRRQARDAGGPTGPKPTIALLRLAYEGPPDKTYLRDSLPLILAERLRSSRVLEVVPFDTSRRLDAKMDIGSLAKQLNVGIVVLGSLQVRPEGVAASFRARRPDNSVVWTRDLDGDAQALIAAVDAAAAELLARLAGNRPSPPPAAEEPQALFRYVEGRTLLEGWDVEKNLDKAEAAFRDAIRLDERFPGAHAMLAITLLTRYTETKQPSLIPEARAAAEKAVELGPDYPEAQAALGAVELAQGRSAEAARRFEEGLKLAPGDDSLCRRVARAYAGMQRHQDALAYFQRAIDLRPSYWFNYNVKGSYHYNRGEYEEAKQLFAKVVERHPEGELGYLNLAAMYIVQGQYRDAGPILEAGLRINPTPDLRNNLGLVYYATGRYREAAAEWQAAIDLGSRSAITFSNLGDAHRQLGAKAEARAAYVKAVSLGRERLGVNPKDAEARSWLAMALAGLGDCPQAGVEAERAVSGGSSSPTHHYYAAISNSLCGRRPSAIRHILKAIEGGSVLDVQTNPDLKAYLTEPRVQAALREKRPG